MLTKEQIAAQCELWLDETDDRLVGRDGEVLTWRQAIVSGLFAIYFGTTRRTLEIEWLRWLTERGLPGAENGRNRPVLRRMTGETITMKEAEDELGFWCAEVGVGDIVNHNCRGKEDYLQTHLTNSTSHEHFPRFPLRTMTSHHVPPTIIPHQARCSETTHRGGIGA